MADCGHLTGSDAKLMRSSGKILQAAALGAGIKKPYAKVIISKVTSVNCGFYSKGRIQTTVQMSLLQDIYLQSDF